jgi:trehalose 6-phosphate phosphatase
VGAPLEGFGPFIADPATAAIFTDFDGTLAAIVTDPARAAPLPGAVDVLHRLATRLALVAVVSGRPVAYLRERLGDELRLSGLYGLETWDGRSVVEVAAAAPWRAVVADVVAEARREFGDAVEPKGLSLTVHFRAEPSRASAVVAWAAEAGDRTGLVVRPAKASVELHPPVESDKGTVVERAAAGLGSVTFLGDDVGDLAAFDALDRLAASGVHTVKVAVATEETPAVLVERADVVVDGPVGALALLRELDERLAQTDVT